GGWWVGRTFAARAIGVLLRSGCHGFPSAGCLPPRRDSASPLAFRWINGYGHEKKGPRSCDASHAPPREETRKSGHSSRCHGRDGGICTWSPTTNRRRRRPRDTGGSANVSATLRPQIL